MLGLTNNALSDGNYTNDNNITAYSSSLLAGTAAAPSSPSLCVPVLGD